jgi:hypothetical protein
VAVADGFLGRWSQRKQAVREGKAVEEPLKQVAIVRAKNPATSAQTGSPISADSSTTAPEAAPQAPPPPTHKEVELLTQTSDFSPFMARDVAPDVRNAAMKKLFTDPHYNVMDQLDIYIDDYSKPDPLPQAMLRQMVGAQFLNLFEDEAKKDKPETSALPTSINNPTPSLPQDQSPNHDHTDLRLQPNHAAGYEEPGRRT